MIPSSGWCKSPSFLLFTYFQIMFESTLNKAGNQGIAWNQKSVWKIDNYSGMSPYGGNALDKMLNEKGFYLSGTTVFITHDKDGKIWNAIGQVGIKTDSYCVVKVDKFSYRVDYECVKPREYKDSIMNIGSIGDLANNVAIQAESAHRLHNLYDDMARGIYNVDHLAHIDGIEAMSLGTKNAIDRAIKVMKDEKQPKSLISKGYFRKPIFNDVWRGKNKIKKIKVKSLINKKNG